jgi:DNA-binding transcriptional MerR regulator
MNIGQVAKQGGISVKKVRHYESIGLLPKGTRTAANDRVYGPNDVQFLRFVRRAQPRLLDRGHPGARRSMAEQVSIQRRREEDRRGARGRAEAEDRRRTGMSKSAGYNQSCL